MRRLKPRLRYRAARLGKRDAAAQWFRTASGEDEKFALRTRAALAAARLARNRAEEKLALALLESSTATAEGDERRDALAVRAELAGRLASTEALDRAARDLIEWEPALIESGRIPLALSRRARRLFAGLSATDRISVCRRLSNASGA